MRNGRCAFPAPTADAVGAAILSAMALCAMAAPWDPGARDYVSVLGGGLRVNGAPLRLVCASGVSVEDAALRQDVSPEGDGVAEEGASDSPVAALAARYAAAGFGMVRLEALSVEGAENAAPDSLAAREDEFIFACRTNGLRVWAEVLRPAVLDPPLPSDAELIDDPATRDAWAGAVAADHPSNLFFAAPWDPRLEVLVQKRIRAWTRAFNARTGLRRADDPVYALFSLSSRWWDNVFEESRKPLPAFFERELEQAWNHWLWARNADTNALARMIGPLFEGEDAAQGTVRLLPFGDAALSARRRSAQRRFLFGLADEHFSRLAAPFSESGPAPAFAPLLVRYGADWTLASASSITIETWRPAASERPGERGGGASGDSPPAMPSVPLIFDATAADTPEWAQEAAAAARLRGASILLLPCGNDPERFAAAAAAFLSE